MGLEYGRLSSIERIVVVTSLAELFSAGLLGDQLFEQLLCLGQQLVHAPSESRPGQLVG